MHANSPISRLTNEILAFIFETVHQDAITVSHVNRHWRWVALRSPFLWRNVRLGLCSDQIREYLNRSQPLSLAITFDVVDKDLRDEDDDSCDEYSYDEDPQENPEAFMARLSMLIHHVSRWHSIHVNCTSAKTVSTILGYLGDTTYITHISPVYLHLLLFTQFVQPLSPF
jgi:hypothetical protein